MISREHRFHGRGSLKYVYKNGQTVRGEALNLRYCANPRRSSYRAAIIVSRKVSKSAVVRNRIRRRLYECLRLQADQLNTPSDIVLTVFSDYLEHAPAAEVERLVRDLLARAKLLSPA